MVPKEEEPVVGINSAYDRLTRVRELHVTAVDKAPDQCTLEEYVYYHSLNGRGSPEFHTWLERQMSKHVLRVQKRQHVHTRRV